MQYVEVSHNALCLQAREIQFIRRRALRPYVYRYVPHPKKDVRNVYEINNSAADGMQYSIERKPYAKGIAIYLNE